MAIMNKMSDTFFRKLFFWGALWNISAALTGLFFYNFQFSLFFGPESLIDNFYQVLAFKMSMLAILLFGIGYYIVSKELTLNRAIVWLGMIGKIVLFFIFTYYFIEGKATFVAFMVFFGDFIWAILFAMFLYQTREEVKFNNLIG